METTLLSVEAWGNPRLGGADVLLGPQPRRLQFHLVLR